MSASSSDIAPSVDRPSRYYCQFLSWKITENDWNKEGTLVLQLGTKIPGTVIDSRSRLKPGGFASLTKKGVTPDTAGRLVRLKTYWPKDVEVDNIHIDMEFKLKKGSVEIGQFAFRNSAKTSLKVGTNTTKIALGNLLINPSLMNLYDEARAFTIEAEIQVLNKASIQVPSTIDSFQVPSEFVKDMGAIFNSKETSDMEIVCNGKVFKCHRTILCARSVIFKNMLLGDTREHEDKKVDVKDTTVEAVEEMLKYIYTGEISEHVDKLNEHLLQLADMYHLDTLKAACGEAILSKLDVSNCISSFIVVDRYFTAKTRVRKMLDMFMRCKAEEVVECEDWDQLNTGFPGLARDLMRVMVKGVKEVHGCWYCNINV